MESTTIPLSHIQIALTISGLFITTAAMAFGAAWTGVKLSLKSLKTEIDAIKEARKDRGVAVYDLQRDKLDVVECERLRVACGEAKIQMICGMAAQISALTAALSNQDEKRQQAVKDNADMFSEIRSQVAVLTNVASNLSRHSESLENLIRRRPVYVPAGTGEDG
ncbi:MAG: hypothetical protein V1844_09995 [Pseudomonadota bacterium]